MEFDEIAKQLKPIVLPTLEADALVSVLVANYNYAKYIGQAIESVLQQTYQNFEVIVCDDGSTDNSREVVQGRASRDPRVKLIAKENGGIASALNATYAASRGEVICLLDADDVFLPEKLEKVVQAFRGAPQAGECIHRIVKMHGDGRTFSYPRPPFLVSGWVATEALRTGSRVRNLPPASGLSFRRPAADLLFPLSTELRRMVDAYLSHAAQFFTEICAVEGELSQQRIHEDNVTSGSGLTVPIVRRFLEDMSLVTIEMRKILTAQYGPAVAAMLHVEDNAQYGNFLAALHVLDAEAAAQFGEMSVQEVVHRIQPRTQRVLARILLAMPRSTARGALQFWTGQLTGTALTVRAVRTMLGV